MGFQPDYHTEAVIYAKHILANVKDAKIGVLYQNDDYGKDYSMASRRASARRPAASSRSVTYEATDPTVDSQIIQLKNSGANVFFNVVEPQVRGAGACARRPTSAGSRRTTSTTCRLGGAVMKPAGFDNAQGIITAACLKDPTDQQWPTTTEMKEWRAWMDKYMPGANQADANYIYAYGVGYLMRETLKRCGDVLTRENLMKQAASFQKFRVPLLLPGITVKTSPTDFYPIQAVQLPRFKGETWELFGEMMHAESS